MSLGCSNMAGGILGTAFSLLLLASIIQGLQDVEVFQYEKVEAVVGQNVTLPCILQDNALKIVSVEWRKNKKENTKLALYSPVFGLNLFWPNVTLQIENMGSQLHLYQVAKQDSGFYICDIATFPLGSIMRETELKIKDDVKIMCDVESAIEVYTGENVTIQCRDLPDAKYKWTKNRMLVSENESLELWVVTDAHTGVYTLTVNTGNRSLHKDFMVTVLTATTRLGTELVTMPPRSNVTVTESADRSPPTRLSTTGPNTTWTMNVTDENSNSTTVTAEEHMTSLTEATHTAVTSSSVTHTDPRPNNATHQEINPTHSLNTSTLSDQSVGSNPATTLSYGHKVFRSTQETRNEPTEGNPGSNLTSGNAVVVIEDAGTDGVQTHLLLLLIIVPILGLITLAGFFYMRHTSKKRMDLPPPFKPPPPPVKYTSARHYEISTQHFPTSRCDSNVYESNVFMYNSP